MLPAGRPGSPLAADRRAEAGAALAVALGRDAALPVVADCGRADEPVACRRRGRGRDGGSRARLLPDVAPGGALAALAATTGVVLVEEPGRTLSRREVADVLGVPVLTRVPVREQVIARAVDAGVLAARMPGAPRARATASRRAPASVPPRRGAAV